MQGESHGFQQLIRGLSMLAIVQGKGDAALQSLALVMRAKVRYHSCDLLSLCIIFRTERLTSRWVRTVLPVLGKTVAAPR